jgi:nicotinamide-nucleotide amidase
VSLPVAEIIAVGSELLTPTKVDTNSLWLTDQLNAQGIEVVAKAVIGDDRNRLADAVRCAAAHSTFVFLTGGLGPTEDDVTRDAVALALSRSQSFREELLEQIAARFRRINRPMADNNRRQAVLIDGAEAMTNDRGTAPGQWIAASSCHVALLPGPPHELKAMFELQVLPRLLPLLPQMVLRTRFYRVAGIGESDLDKRIAPLYTKYENPATTILASPGDVHIHLRARCATAEEAEVLLKELGLQIEAELGSSIYSTDGASLEEVVGRLLLSRSESVCVAESMTGGYVGERLTRVAGSSGYFRGGFLTYSNDLKQRLLGVDASLLEKESAVSEPVASAMASGAREKLGSDWAISVTGYAGPDADPVRSIPAGTVFVGIVGPGDVSRVYRFNFGGDRGRIRSFATTYALDSLRKILQHNSFPT